MRIVIDLHSVQEPNYRARGIGRSSLSLALAMVRQAGEHEIILALNGAFTESIEFLREEFRDLLPPENFRIWHGLTPTHASDSANRWRRKATALLREESLAALKPDIVLVTSLFQGFGDNSVISIGVHHPNLTTAVMSHDLIPLIYPQQYLADPAYAAWYHDRLDHLRRADLILAISESSRLETVNYLGMEVSQTVNISSAINSEFFHPSSLSDGTEARLRGRYGLRLPFVMYTGAEDPRKNIDGLIGGFAKIDKNLRRNYQLAIVCSLPLHIRQRLEGLAAKRGLESGDVIFTDFVPDGDLLALYRLCHLFVFPSWHEGFGLPVLEAMACGAPTLASNCSSLPEVVGWDEALFDPRDERDIARAIERALADEIFRQKLKTHGLRQAGKFSWDVSAQRALQAMEAHVESHRAAQPAAAPAKSVKRRPRLAYFSPLQPAKSGISDYSAELLPELARHYDIDVVVDQQEAVTDPWVLANSTQRSVAWFEDHADLYDRILYQFGNSPFHQHMFGLLDRHPGVVVLHDFFLSAVGAYMEASGVAPGIWARSLQRAHGWEALRERCEAEAIADVVYKYPCNLEVLQRAQGVICHSDYSRQLAAQWYGPDWGKDWALIPLLRMPSIGQPRSAAREALGLTDDDFMVCSFGSLDKTKCNIELLESWLASPLGKDKRCKLVFVGALPLNDYGEEIRQWLQRAELKHRVRITGPVDRETYRNYLAAADLAVQLRTLSRGETSAAVLDCMNYGLPTIVNANGSMAELPAKAVHLLPDNFTTTQLAEALEHLWRSPAKRAALGKRAAQHIREQHAPRRCADRYVAAIEQFAQQAADTTQGLLKAAARLGMPDDRQDLAHFAERAAQLFPAPRPQAKQLLLDISELAQRDAKTGIQRVVRSIMAELLEHPPEGYRVEPVFATMEHGYRYARRFTAGFLELDDMPLADDPIEVHSEDIFFGLDYQADVVFRHRAWLDECRLKGARTYFLVHDLLPVTHPEFFTDGTEKAVGKWLSVISKADGVVCVSQTVAQEFARWLKLFGKRGGDPLKIGWSHSGSDLKRKVNGHDIQLVHARLLDAMGTRPTFLMVGTIEPRKGHAQVLAAFDLLWREGIKANLVIVGKLGWMVDFEERVRLHPQRDRQLFWLQGIGDDLLEQIYGASACLIAASADEGFGLPLIEAARHRLPIMARDIPVFREVAGDHAFYFTGEAPRELAEAVKTWLDLDCQGRAPRSDAMPWLTWKESTRNLLHLILGGKWQSQWAAEKDADLIFRYWGSDDRHHTQVGERRGELLHSMGRAGYLLYGHYVSLKKGNYRATIHGKVGFGGAAGAYADVAVKAGTILLAKVYLQPAENEQDMPLATLDFSLDQNHTDLEIRVFVEEESDVRVSLVELRNGDVEHEWLASGSDQQRIARPAPRALMPPAPQAWEHRYWASHPRFATEVGYRVGRSVWSTGKTGYLLYGPYIGMPAGRYAGTVYGRLNKPGGFGEAYIDAAAKQGKLLLAAKKLAESDAQPGILGTIEFSLEGYVDDVEVRVRVDAEADLHVTGFEITELQAEALVGVATLASIETEPPLNGTTAAIEPAPLAVSELAKPTGAADEGPPRAGIVHRKQRTLTKNRQGRKSRAGMEV